MARLRRTIKSLEDAARLILERLEAKENCLIYKGVINSQGYGKIETRLGTLRVHRVMAHYYGLLDYNDKHYLACHIVECPNKSCVKREHLYKGTYSTNRRDVLELRPDPKRKVHRLENKK